MELKKYFWVNNWMMGNVYCLLSFLELRKQIERSAAVDSRPRIHDASRVGVQVSSTNTLS